ncbi:MAG: TonB-dependent receptor [Bacteroidota bacterium]
MTWASMKLIMTKRIIFLFCAVFMAFSVYGQQKATIEGKVVDENNSPLFGVGVGVIGQGDGDFTDERGNYSLEVPTRERLNVIFNLIGFKTDTIQVGRLKPGQVFRVNAQLTSESYILETPEITDTRITDDQNLDVLDSKPFEYLPSPNFNLDISSIGVGVTGSADELSSQYSVRGGSYDENLVYVNDFEIYRPFLVRSGQQEGLTFPNIDLISSLAFSAGGFQARFGDKLSSVLDIKYKQPDSTRTSVSLSLLGATAHIEGSIKKKKDENQRFRYLAGVRYKTTRYLLGSLETTGEYTPNFIDFQYYLTYDLSPTWQLGWIANVNRSVYEFIPKRRSTTLGLINLAFQFNVLFEGQEVDDFTTYMTGLSLSHVPKGKNYYFKFLASTFKSLENERIDILGRYSLGVLETDLSDDSAGEVVAVIGAGTQHTYVRNYLDAMVSNFEIKGGWQKDKENEAIKKTSSHHLRYGVKYQLENIEDDINEWERLDSAGYSLPYSASSVNLFNTVKGDVDLQSHRISGYIQDTWKVVRDSSHEIGFTLGVRSSYWSLNEEVIITPRAQFYYMPLKSKNRFILKASIGAYYQPPFYREMRNLSGDVNTNLKAQKSIHAVLGLTYDFQMWNRPFRFISELYYKNLSDIVAFDVDNVRIRYYGENNVSGYAAGIDFRLNGEFIPGTESWINLSLLRTRESFNGVDHMKREIGDSTGTVVGDVARPTDQLVSLSMFFQDYLPKREDFRVHLNLVLGTGLPFGIPQDNVVYRNTYRYSPYYRVDIGFGYLLWDAKRRTTKGKGNPFRSFRKAWMSLEVFNLLQVANAASNTWVKTIENQQLAVPNFLTSRRVNLRIKTEF